MVHIEEGCKDGEFSLMFTQVVSEGEKSPNIDGVPEVYIQICLHRFMFNS